MSNGTQIEPPKGFTLDSDETAIDVKPPSGFVLDTSDKKKVLTSLNGSTDSSLQSDQDGMPFRSPTQIVSEFSGGGSLFPKVSNKGDGAALPKDINPITKVPYTVKVTNTGEGYTPPTSLSQEEKQKQVDESYAALSQAGKALASVKGWNVAMDLMNNVTQTITGTAFGVGSKELKTGTQDFFDNLKLIEPTPEKGITVNNVIGAATSMVPFLTAFATGSGQIAAASKVLGMGEKAAHITGIVTTNMVLTYNDAYNAATEAGVKSEIAKTEYALGVTAMGGMLFTVFPALRQIKGFGTPAALSGWGLNALTKSLIEGVPAKEAAKNALKVVGKAVIDNVENTGVMTGVELSTKLGQAVSNISTGEQSFDTTIDPQEIGEHFVINALALSPLSALKGAAAFKERNQMQKQALYYASKDPERYKAELGKMLEEGKISIEQFANANMLIGEVAGVIGKIPENFPQDKAIQVIPALIQKTQAEQERNDAQRKLSAADPNFRTLITKEVDAAEGKIETANEEIKTIISEESITEQNTRSRTSEEIERIQSDIQKRIDTNDEIIKLTGKDNAGEAIGELSKLVQQRTDEANAAAKERLKGKSRTSDGANKIYDEEFEKAGVNRLNELIDHLNNSNDVETFKTTSLSQEASEFRKEQGEVPNQKVRIKSITEQKKQDTRTEEPTIENVEEKVDVVENVSDSGVSGGKLGENKDMGEGAALQVDEIVRDNQNGATNNGVSSDVLRKAVAQVNSPFIKEIIPFGVASTKDHFVVTGIVERGGKRYVTDNYFTKKTGKLSKSEKIEEQNIPLKSEPPLQAAPTETQPQTIENQPKTKLQLAKEKFENSFKESQENRKKTNTNLGAIKDPLKEAKKQAELDRQTFDDLVDYAREGINEEFKTLKQFIERIPEELKKHAQIAWKVANNTLKYEDAVKEVEKLSEGRDIPPIEPKILGDGEGEPGMGKREFTQKVLEKPEITEELKEGLPGEAIWYEKITNKSTLAEADRVITENGLENSLIDLMDSKADIADPVKVLIGQRLIRLFDLQASKAAKAGDKRSENMLRDRAIQAADFTAEFLTNTAQTLQAASVFSELSPTTTLRMFNKMVRGYREKKIADNKTSFDKKSDVLEKANKEAIEEVLESKPIKEQVIKGEKTRTEKTKEKISKVQQERKQIIEKYKKGGKNILSANGLTNEGLEFIGEITANLIKEGVIRAEDLVGRVIDAVKEVSGKTPDATALKQIEKIAKDNVKGEAERLTKEGLKQMDVKIDKVIREHYTVVEKVKKDLVKKLMDETDLSEAQAKEMARQVKLAFNKLATQKKNTALKKLATPREKLKPKEARTQWDKLIEYTNLGAFDKADFNQKYADILGFPKLTDAQRAEVIRLSEKIQTYPEGSFKRFRATEDLLKYQSKLKGVDWTDVATSVWYAGILSGYKTQALNAVANFMNTVGELTVAAAYNPKATPYLIKGLWNGYWRGMYEAYGVMKTGYSPIRGKLQIPSVLETFQFKGGKGFDVKVGGKTIRFKDGWLNPANYAKYVLRFMTGVDVFSYEGLKEMRAYELGRRVARTKGLKGVELSKEVDRQLFRTPELLAEYRKQAAEEGNVRGEINKRAWELMEQNRPAVIIEESRDFARRGTFNYDPEGFLGVLSDGMQQVSNSARPLKFIVPFTRILSNVANNALDWSPLGLFRAAKGGIGSRHYENIHWSKAKFRKYTPEQRAKELIKAGLGTSLAASLYVMAAYGDEDEDQHNKVFDITANGTGDYRKNYNLTETGWKEKSIKIGDTWYNYANTPVAIPLYMVGKIRDQEKYEIDDPKTFAKKLEIATWAVGGNLTDMTFLGSLSDFMNKIDLNNIKSTQEGIKDFLERTGKSAAIPNFLNQGFQQLEAIMGANQKQTDGFFQTMVKDIPIARNSLNDRINALGDVIPVRSTQFTSNIINDPVWDFIIEHNAWVPTISKNQLLINDPKTETMRNVTDDEYYEFAKLRGEKIRAGIEDIMANGIDIDTGEVDAEGKKITIHKTAEEATASEIKDEIDNIKTAATKKAKEELFNLAENINSTDPRTPQPSRTQEPNRETAIPSR